MRLNEVVLVVELLVELATNPRELKVTRNLSVVEARGYFLLEDNQLVFHLGIDVPLFVGRPKAPERIGDDVSLFGLLLDTKDIVTQLLEYILSLKKLLLFLHFVFDDLFVHHLLLVCYLMP